MTQADLQYPAQRDARADARGRAALEAQLHDQRGKGGKAGHHEQHVASGIGTAHALFLENAGQRGEHQRGNADAQAVEHAGSARQLAARVFSRIVSGGDCHHHAGKSQADGIHEASDVEITDTGGQSIQGEADGSDQGAGGIDRSPSHPVGQAAGEADQGQYHDLVDGHQQAGDLPVPLGGNADDLGQHIGLREAQEADDRHDRQRDVEIGPGVQAAHAVGELQGAEPIARLADGVVLAVQWNAPAAMQWS